MSLIGIDVGSTGTKIAAYSEEGALLGSVYSAHTPRHPVPGSWEVDAQEVWNNAVNGLRKIAAMKPVKLDPPKAIAISASTREGFPVDADGKPLGPCIMTADTRESGMESAITAEYSQEKWFEFCGHLPERMDPVCRLIWWEKNRPEVIAKTRYFLGWGEYFSLKLTGRAVTDRSHAGRFFVYDFGTHNWSRERISQFKIRADVLPEPMPWGEVIGTVKKEVSHATGLPSDLKLGVGANDAVCCVLGSGVSEVGTGCLISGSWENVLLPVTSSPPASKLIQAGVSIGPYPGKASMMIYALSPTGNAALNWARNVVGVRVQETDAELRVTGLGPSPVMALPHVSGAIVPWVGGARLRGALLGLTLATTNVDIIKAVMEGITYDLSYTVEALKQAGAKIDALKGVGGGIRSEWWTQLKADLTATTIDVVDQPELGTLGAALLAGLAVGIYTDIERKADEFTKVTRSYAPNSERARLYKQRMEFYRSFIAKMLQYDWSKLAS